MKRRKFIKYSGTLMCGATLLPSCQHNTTQQKLKGFIISDAHIGWDHPDQPSIEQQQQHVARIVEQFPDLDVAFDTGDAHHGSLTEQQRKMARTQWLDNIANQFSHIPFHYVPGNHELGKGERDPEIVAGDLGSIPFRPYYAFDHMGVHFISLPQLLSTILISKESLNWLKLDLHINRDKTTIILSHNSIKGTTFNNNETGYRCMVNSEEVMTVLDANPQVVAWFHGHNHQYEIVKLKNRVYVSNGRIGGFNPPQDWGDFGQGHLGGIYFEVSATELSIKAYSASSQTMLDQLGMKHLSLTIQVDTSFDATATFNYYCGHGTTTNKVPYQLNNHYLTEHRPQLVYQDTNESLNENADFKYPTNFFFAGKDTNKIIGYRFDEKSIKFTHVKDHITIDNSDMIKKFALVFPIFKNKKHGLYKRGSYYRCTWQQSYLISISTSEPLSAYSSLSLSAEILDFNMITIKQIDAQIHDTKDSTIIFQLNTGESLINTTHQIYLTLKLQFNNFPEQFLIHSIHIRPHDNGQNSVQYIEHNQQKHTINTPLQPQTLSLSLIDKNHDTMSFNVISNKAITWLIKYSAIEWQIRNATGYMKGGHLYITPNHSNYHQTQTVIISPTHKPSFYLNKAIHISPFTVQYHNKHQLNITLEQLSDNNELVFYSTSPISSLSGARLLSSHSSGFRLKATNQKLQVIVQ